MTIDHTYTLIKPHHFLDYLYEIALHDEMEDSGITGSNNASLFKVFSSGKLTRIKFTPFVDEICRPCKLIISGKCQDFFDEATTIRYGTNSKNEFNYKLDIKLNKALPNVFQFDTPQDMKDVLLLLKENLTNEIIGYYLWERPNRNELTFVGIDKALTIYR